ncbi:MAG: PQQ-binding-like beta-propeller repeat protein [Gemmataceae bacterium]
MRTQLATVLAVAVGAAALLAQTRREVVYSRPTPPSAEVLDRLNLHLAWNTAVPMDGKRDGFLRIEVIGPDVFVVTRSGLVARLDGETGRMLWRTRVDRPYTMMPYVAVNRRSVYLVANAYLHSLDRETGSVRWEFPVPGGIAAPPEVDNRAIYLTSFDGTLYAFQLPTADSSISPDAAAVRVTGGFGSDSQLETLLRPRVRWSAQTNLEPSFRPVQSTNRLLVVSPEGRGIVFAKIPKEGVPSAELYRYRTEGRILVPPTAYGDVAYVGSDDGILYALDLPSGKGVWRYTAGYRITRQPISLDEDVFITSEQDGLTRINRETGEALWRIPRGSALVPGVAEADRFLAANDRFVYTSDHSGRLLILDRHRGRRLSMVDTTAYRFPVINSVTDRLYLAAHDGTILCLHDYDQKSPIRHRRILERQLRARLETPISAEGVREPMRLADALERFTGSYAIEFRIDDAAFRRAGLPSPAARNVTLPRIDNKPLSGYLRTVLGQAGASYTIEDEMVMVVPAPPPAKK